MVVGWGRGRRVHRSEFVFGWPRYDLGPFGSWRFVALHCTTVLCLNCPFMVNGLISQLVIERGEEEEESRSRETKNSIALAA